MTTTTYRPAGTSALERRNVPTECGCCGRTDLNTTVKLAGDDGSVVWMGTGCAAKAMGIGIPAFRKAAKAADTATELEARREANRKEAEQDARWDAFLEATAGPGERLTQIARLGGIAAARDAFLAA